jgi:hypothetical protein
MAAAIRQVRYQESLLVFVGQACGDRVHPIISHELLKIVAEPQA